MKTTGLFSRSGQRRATALAVWIPILLVFASSCTSPAPRTESTVKEPVPAGPGDQNQTAPFVVGIGDKLTVQVWRNTDLTTTTSVDPNGRINLPLVGEVQAAGLTIQQLRDDISGRLATYLKNPSVTVNITETRSRRVYVLGEVQRPGAVTLDRSLHVWEAIAEAGGLTLDANRHDVLLARQSQNAVHVSAVEIGLSTSGDTARAPILQNGDFIYVLPSTIADVERFMIRFKNILSPIVSAESAIVLGADVNNVLNGEDIKRGAVFSP